jgi:uroporphyrinogen-III synthase
MRNHLNTRKSPLSETRILVGRARHQASKLSSGLRRLGAEVIEIPFIEIRKARTYRPLDYALRAIRDYHWLIFTSVNGVDAFWERLRKLRLTRAHLRHIQMAAIGPATKQAIEARGLKVRVIPEEYVAESVVKSLRDRVEGKRVLLARAKLARDVIPRELRKLGAEVDVVEAYETVVPRSSARRLRSLLANSRRRPHVIAFTSSSSVRNFISLLGPAQDPRPVAKTAKERGTRHKDLLNDTQLASIGPVTSSTLREFGLPVHIEAKEYTIPGLVKAIKQSLAFGR